MKLPHPMRAALVSLVIPLFAIPFLAACASPLEAPGPEAPGPDPTISGASTLTDPPPTPSETAAVAEDRRFPTATAGPIQHEIMATRSHVADGVTVTYNSVPPTSGDHWAEWSRCGFFPLPIPDERLVHNLEHGNIVVSFNLTTSEEVGRLREALEEIDLSAEWGVSRSYDRIPPGTVALAAWGVSDTMPGIIPERIRSFFETFAGKQGPERIPCSDSGVVPPGMGRGLLSRFTRFWS